MVLHRPLWGKGVQYGCCGYYTVNLKAGVSAFSGELGSTELVNDRSV